ncbi:MAG: DNA polymerase III subunit epsilon [Legionellales bacterium]|nr:DNA polymerase III subunit epsilon [Legionellales bacterium]|tara:strand:- start:1563 stop:2249 length:687 start_codon:yes stop_codon:yes gene_type:complete
MKLRQIILDTETTGIDPKHGHRIIEIGCLEMIDRRLTGEHYHVYINPEREVDKGAYAVHGIGDEFLQDKPLFAEIFQGFFDFINGAQLIIHNAPFDVKFIDHEFALYDKKIGKVDKYCSIFDTLTYARKKHPGQKNNLDALCKRYHVDNSNRDYHGALLDSELLAQVYLAMTGGQGNLFSGGGTQEETGTEEQGTKLAFAKELPVVMANDTELAEHNAYMAELKREEF